MMKPALITLAIATLGAAGYAYIKNPAETKLSLMNSWVALRTFNPSAVKGKGSTVILAPFMLAGFVIVPLVSLITKAPDKVFVEQIFSCYERKVTVTVKDSIGAEEK